MYLALFDLDNTLLDGDAETLWFEYLHQAGHLEGDFFGKLEEFTNDYDQEELDFSEYLNFILLPLKKWGPEKVKPWREQFLLEKSNQSYVIRTSCMIIEDKGMSLF